jgi:pyruvate/2-oxoglutarate dehydrogenase complex dihydrolipoamide dehydrogenase (E3) component
VKEQHVTETEQFDVIVIGAGQSGGPLAGAFGTSGKRVALIERAHVGGTCINNGCTPTKAMVASARVAHVARRAGHFGVRTAPVEVDLARVRRRKRAVVEAFRKSSLRQVESTPNLELIYGVARFTGYKELDVRLNAGGQRRMTAELLIINTGGRPMIPPIDGLVESGYLDSTSIMELGELPERLLILGGGYVGLEFAQMFRRFGSRVTLIQRGERLIALEDLETSEAVTKILRQDGVEVRFNASASRVARDSTGKLALTVETEDGEQTLSGDQLLVATGREPSTDELDPAASGVTLDERGYIPVNDRLATNVSGIFAVGDVNGGPAFTHISYDDYRVLKTLLIEGGDASRSNRMQPYVMFTDPQLGRVGLSAGQAREQSLDVSVYEMPASAIARAGEIGETRGFLQAVVDNASGQLLGATVLSFEGGELMALFQIAMAGGLHYTELRDMVLSHPTFAEGLNNLFAGEPT